MKKPSITRDLSNLVLVHTDKPSGATVRVELSAPRVASSEDGRARIIEKLSQVDSLVGDGDVAANFAEGLLTIEVSLGTVQAIVALRINPTSLNEYKENLFKISKN